MDKREEQGVEDKVLPLHVPLVSVLFANDFDLFKYCFFFPFSYLFLLIVVFVLYVYLLCVCLLTLYCIIRGFMLLLFSLNECCQCWTMSFYFSFILIELYIVHIKFVFIIISFYNQLVKIYWNNGERFRFYCI